MNKVIFIFLGIVIGFLASCRKDNTDEKLKEEEDKLAAYMADHPDAVKVNGYEAYVVTTKKQDEGAKVDAGDYILWNYTVKNFETGETEYTSNKTSNIIYQNSYVYGGPELTLVLTSALDEGIKLLKKGESGDIYIPSRYIFADFQTRIWKVEIVNVITDLNVYQKSLMYNYLREINFQNTGLSSVDTIKNVESSIDNKKYDVLFYIVDQGDETTPITPETTKIETRTSAAYTIQEGVVHSFVSESDFSWSSTSTKTKTDCVGEILRKMNKGGKVIIAMPHILYYGEEPFLDDKKMQIVVPMKSVLIFTITIKA